MASLIEDGQKFVFNSLGLGEEQFKLIGKLVWLETDEIVDSMNYTPGKSHFYVRLREVISVESFRRLLGKYDLPEEFSKHTSVEALVRSEGIDVLFGGIDYS